MQPILQTISVYIIYITVFLAPIALLPIFPDPFGLPKLLVLVCGIAAAIFVKSLTGIRKSKREFSRSRYDLIPCAAAFVYLVAALVRTRNVMGVLFVPGTGTIVIGAAFLYVLIRRLKDEEKERIHIAILLSAVASAGLVIITTIKQSSLTFFGDPLIAIVFFLILIPFSAQNVIREKDIPKKVFWGSVILLFIAAIAISLIPILSGKFALPPAGKTFPLFIAGASLLALLSKTRSMHTVTMPKFIFLTISAASVLVMFFLGKFALAEYFFKQAGDALIAEKEEESYTLLQKAINTSPFVDRYHLAYAQLNMVIAKELIQKQTSTQEDRALVAKLTQQAVNEGKKTVFLSPKNAANWEALGALYETLPATEETVRFAIQAYSQAILLEPTNPRLRIDLGRAYYAAGEYDKAKEILTTVLSLANPTSTEFWQAKRALERLESR